jgi:hypothetical protein
MPESVVVDAGGILAAGGLLGVDRSDGGEILALDCSSLLVGRFLQLRHEGAQGRALVELGVCLDVVDEWFPVRALVGQALNRCESAVAADLLDAWCSVVLAEELDLPILTASDEVTSDQVEVLHPW